MRQNRLCYIFAKIFAYKRRTYLMRYWHMGKRRKANATVAMTAVQLAKSICRESKKKNRTRSEMEAPKGRHMACNESKVWMPPLAPLPPPPPPPPPDEEEPPTSGSLSSLSLSSAKMSSFLKPWSLESKLTLKDHHVYSISNQSAFF